MENLWLTAAGWVGLATLGSLLAGRLGIPVALADLALGAAAGNLLGFQDQQWLGFLAGLGSIGLTFLAGAEVTPEVLRANLQASLAIGAASFLAPFAVAWAVAALLLGWATPAAQMAGIVLGETSVAIVYMTTLEAGLAGQRVGAVLLGACFITSTLMLLTLGLLFAHPDGWTAATLAATVLAMAAVPRLVRWLRARRGGASAQTEVKLLLAVLLVVQGLAAQAGSSGALPAYLLGMAMAGAAAGDPAVLGPLRSLAFGLLTPLFFLRAGALIDLGAVAAGPSVVLVLLGAKLAAKVAGVFPVARWAGLPAGEARVVALLLATGLTLANIAAGYGLASGVLSREQYTALLAAVAGSALLPTLVAQRLLRRRKPAPQPVDTVST